MPENNNQRLLITVALCMMAALGWSYFFNPSSKPKPGARTAVTQPAHPADEAKAAVEPPAQADKVVADVSRGTTGAAKKYPTQTVVLESEKLRATLTSDGGALLRLELKGDKYKRQLEVPGEAPQVDLAAIRPGQLAALSTVVRGAAPGSALLVPADTTYEVVSQEARQVVFRTVLNGITVKKTVDLDPQTYKLDVKLEVTSAAALAGELVVSYDAKTLPAGQGGGGWFSSRTNVPSQSICETAGNKPERLAPGAKKPTWEGPSAVFAGIDEQYFLAALVPAAGTKSTCKIGSDAAGDVTAALSFPLALAGGDSASTALVVYAGPKETDLLSSVAAPLKDSVDLGFWWLIARVLLEVMKFFYKVVPIHNWGIAIILLTLTVKLVTFPLQHKSMKSMQEMQRIQPQLDEMKKKFAGDQQRQNVEQMKLFKEHGVNPMGSCLPMVIQMPVWIALYTTLQVSVELYHSVFIPGWLNDLTAKDPYYILPVAMGITMFLTQLLTPSPMSQPGQKVMGYAMTAFFSFLMLNLPSGLTLYIFINNVLSIAQQMYLRRSMKGGGGGTAAGAIVTVTPKRI